MTDTILDRANVVAAGTATTREDAIREAGELLVAAGAVAPGYVDSMRQRVVELSLGRLVRDEQRGVYGMDR